ncbi:MAG: EVE domain-containing protein [Chloroflexi bacterium]|nr:EVE domain-containing protein [Chloroflexota bacterium]MDA1145084.1 EVE domain-containing protein [Chloroflexota bacterium]
MQAWITVGSPDNFEVLRKRKFDVCAFKASRRKQSGEMKPGDRIVYYLTKEVLFGGIVEVTGEMFEDISDIGLRSEGKPGEDYPFRIDTKPVVIPDAGNYVDVREITDLLDKTRKLGPKKLGMAFRGNLHKISDEDYQQIERLLAERT